MFGLAGCIAVDTASGIPKPRPIIPIAPIVETTNGGEPTIAATTAAAPVLPDVGDDASSAYVTRLVAQRHHGALLAAHTMGSVDIIDAATLTRVHWLPHTERLACSVLHSVGVAADDSSIVATCGSDGTLAEWDVRSGELVHAYAARAVAPHALACAIDASSQVTLCGGSRGTVMWFDQRTRAQVRVLADLHSDDVTTLCVAGRGAVLSGADDALVCELQLDGAASLGDDAADDDAANDDDAFLRGCLNVGDAVQQLVVCGRDSDAVACLTNVAVSVWDRASLAPRFTLADHRAATAAAAALPTVDYTVGFHFDAPSDQLWALAGADDGSLVLAAVAPDALVPLATLVDPNNGHYARVRAFTAFNSDVLFTGAEDGNICAWRRGHQASASYNINAATAAPTIRQQRMPRTSQSVSHRVNPF